MIQSSARAPTGTPDPERPRPGTAIGVLLVVVLAGLSACDAPGPGDVRLARPDTIPNPAAPASGEPNLAVGPDGAVYLSWLEPTETGHALAVAALQNGSWGTTYTVIDRPNLFVNWADFPSVAVLDDGSLAAHWLQKSGPGIYAYDVRLALSRDGGVSWSDDIVPHRDRVEAEHGFVSLVPFAGGVAALWLDGRATVDGEPMTLRFTTLAPDGALGPEVEVDGSVCDCCQTAMAVTASGLVAVYRNRTSGEVRDIYAARYADGEWGEGQPIHEDGWVIAGCPVNGPALGARGDTVAVAWFTAAEPTADPARIPDAPRAAGEHGRVLAAFSTDGGGSFGPPVRVDDGAAMGRVDLVLLDDGAVVTWLERTRSGAEVRIRRVTPSGVGPAAAVAGTEAERASGFPRMVRTGDRLVFAWTVPGQRGGIRTAMGRLPAGWTDGKGDTP